MCLFTLFSVYISILTSKLYSSPIRQLIMNLCTRLLAQTQQLTNCGLFLPLDVLIANLQLCIKLHLCSCLKTSPIICRKLHVDLHCIPTYVYASKGYRNVILIKQEDFTLDLYNLTSMANPRSAIFTNCLLIIILSYH